MRFLAPIRRSFALSDPVLVPVPVSIFVPVQISAIALVSTPALVPAFILCSLTGLHLRLRSRSRPDPAPAPAPIWRSFVRLHLSSRSRSGYAPIIVHVPFLVFDPAPDSDPVPDPVLLPVPWTWLPPRYDARVQTPFFCMGVCMHVYFVAHNHAIRPCHPSHYIPLVFSPSRRDQRYLLRND